MTAKWPRFIPCGTTAGRYLGWNSPVPAVSVAVALLFSFVLSASSALLSPPPASASAAPMVIVPAPVLEAMAVPRQVRLGENVETIASIVAKKYRVSEEATLGLVSAAYREALRNGLDPLLVLAVIAVESRFNPIAQSDGGAVGLMQVVPRFHTDKLDASQLARVATRSAEIMRRSLRGLCRFHVCTQVGPSFPPCAQRAFFAILASRRTAMPSGLL